MSNLIATVFGPEGLLKRAFPGYRPRIGQIEMALEVEANAEAGGRLMVEAPTGTGKSVAYLVPMIARAQKGERVMVVTSSIVLQEQLVGKDLPLLASILPEPFTYSIAKGMNNFLCLARETRVVTRDGLRPIAELAGKTVRLLDGNGEWVAAPVRSFGRERLYKVTLDRGSRKMVVHATADHRWFVQPDRQKREFEQVVTRDLEIGSQLAVVHPRKLASHHRPSPFGIAHGIVFGDGSARWRVVSVEQTDRVEEVFCAVVPTTHSFVLEGYLLTGNCLNEYEDLAGDMAMTGSRDPDIQRQWPDVKHWADQTRTGDVSELPFELKPKVRLRVTTNSEDCLGGKCAHKDACYSRRARKRAKGAQIVVTNYHLFFADLSVKSGDPDAGPLGPYKHVVFDEGHDAAEIARDFFGFRIAPGSVRRAVRFLGGNARLGIPPLGDKELRTRVQHASEAFFDQVSEHQKRRDYAGRLESAGAINPTALNAVLSEVSSVYGAAIAGELQHSPQAKEAVALAMARLTSMRAQLEYAAALHEPSKFVYFFEALPPAVCMRPIDVAPMLDQHLFTREDVKSIVMTSATLASGSREGERFNYFSKEIGCRGATELVVDSPFDFARNVLLYLPRPMPEPNAPEFAAAVADVCWDVCQAAGGRALLLFTSFRVLKEVRLTFERRGAPWRLLVHGDAPRALLLEQFKADETSVLLGCESFWQGVDVPGPALSAVVIDKIPFPHHDDPVMGARSAINAHWFGEYALPEAVIAMKQGFGRLVRTATDRGIVAVCDPRLRTKGYGKKITKSLPAGIPSTSSIADVRAFFAGASPEDAHAASCARPTNPRP